MNANKAKAFFFLFACMGANLRTHAFNSLLKNVFEAADPSQKRAKKRSLHVVNEHFEPVFNAAAATQIVFQQAVKRLPTLNLDTQTKAPRI